MFCGRVLLVIWLKMHNFCLFVSLHSSVFLFLLILDPENFSFDQKTAIFVRWISFILYFSPRVRNQMCRM